LPQCNVCLLEVKKIDSNNRCEDCAKSLEDGEKEKEALKESQSHWDKTGQVFFVLNKGFITSPSGNTLILGDEKKVLEILESKKLPAGLNKAQKIEYSRIFKIMEDEENARRSGESNSDIRAPKSGKRNNQRVRSLRTSRSRNKYTKKTKAPKRLSVRRSRR